ncbi:metal ABC transporter permease [Roseofilum casamattae]|uniref:Metal ABC transporter permease n=1 Tax=Roseofilum casamattae BLCC-M143 TaxID=3022442 RepID=A0ABT7BUR9_9CYAN|nr:metal ABC transporter permease [Roseofilum casamattae]MDJ1182840.1 metal ABC transporter permease [Roseofilum casamattae BLCC-M143]
MIFETEIERAIALLQFPFMQRALIGGILAGVMGGLLGSFTVVRQLSFFSNALGHSALLGISIGLLFGIEPSSVILPFCVLFALVVTYFLEHTELWTDALLNMIHAGSLAIAIILLSFIGQYKGGINNLLFGDILAISSSDRAIGIILLCICVAFVSLTLRTQMAIALHEPMAIARGISVSAHRTAFIVLLSLVIGVSIKAIGVLLVSAFIVIPASTARLLCNNFTNYVLFSALLGALSAILGIVLSALFNLPSGPSIVIMQLVLFAIAFCNSLRDRKESEEELQRHRDIQRSS